MANKVIFLALLIASAMLISGCVTGDIRQSIDSKGKANGSVSMSLNLADLYLSQGVPRENFSLLDSVLRDSLCGNFSSSSNLTNTKCGIRNAVLTFSGNPKESNLTSKDGFFKSTGSFNIEYLYVPNMSNFDTGSGSSGLNLAEALANAKKNGGKITYTIDMPGDVYQTEGGTIVSGNAVYELIDVLIQEKAIYVRSKEMNVDFFSYASLALFVSMLILPLIKFVLNMMKKDSIYKDGFGILYTLLLMGGMFFYILMFAMSAFLFFYLPADLSVMGVGGMVFFIMLFIYTALFYLITDLVITSEGISARQIWSGVGSRGLYATGTVRFSEIKKIERAEMDSIFYLGDWMVKTPSGAKLHPKEYWNNGHVSRKGILLYLKNGKTIYMLVRDIDWVIDAVKEKI